MAKENVIPPHGGMGTEKRRMCITNSPDCSGLNPCTECHTYMMVRVLPHAMRAGGYAGNKKQAAAFFKAYADAWKQMQTDPLPPPPVADIPMPPPPAPPVSPTENSSIVVEAAPPPEEVNGHKSKLKRGDVKRMAEQEAETLTSSNPSKPD